MSGRLDIALDYARQRFDIMEELNFNTGIGISSWLISHIYLDKGDLNNALIFCKKIYQSKKLTQFLYLVD
ncbi:MAG: hypothetical protein ACFFG0_21570 [Candidatus Thorarchaeota archaeon]